MRQHAPPTAPHIAIARYGGAENAAVDSDTSRAVFLYFAWHVVYILVFKYWTYNVEISTSLYKVVQKSEATDSWP